MEENINGLFTGNDTVAPVADQGAAKTEGSANDKAERQAMISAFKATEQEQGADFLAKLRSLSSSLEVVNTLGFGKSGNIVADKAQNEANKAAAAPGEKVKHSVMNTSKIVGYVVRNNGTASIDYTTEVWKKGADGVYTSQVVKKTMAPGESIVLNREYMTRFAVRPEISFTFSNGIIVTKSKAAAKMQSADPADRKAYLSSFHFIFSSDAGKAVNDPAVKIPIDDIDENGVSTVKPEYLETFGYLMNPVASTPRAKKAPGKKFTLQELSANLINRQLREEQ